MADMYKPQVLLAGPKQGIYETSAEAKEKLGAKLEIGDGRVFYYAKAGGTALARGKLVVNPDEIGDHINQFVKKAASVGDKKIVMAIGATALTANQYAEGYLVCNDADGEGHYYKIKGHKAYSANALNVEIELYDPIQMALVADTSQVSLHKNPYDGLVISVIDQADQPIGVPVIDVPADHYFWLQTWGLCSVLADENVTKGAMLRIGSGTAGAVEAIKEAASAGTLIDAIVGYAIQPLVDTEYRPIFLMCSK